MESQMIISCEHAGNEVPNEYHHLFEHNTAPLKTHRGIDIGALKLANTIADEMEQESFLHTVTRLLVDLNRSVQSPTLFSEFTKEQPLSVREDIFESYYRPHRKKVKKRVREVIEGGKQAIHVGIHTFTPIWDGQERDVDVGFLFDPVRKGGQRFCEIWRRELNQRFDGLRLRMNQPYRGTMDGFITELRREYPENQYVGIEIEVNQRFACSVDKEEWKELQEEVANSLKAAYKDFEK
ncbi:N-formylglutamate amidohydrolase [Fodinibius halophilus]|uniref:N-formylglutamate amidohydrolase n=1 Tax=Fodinibius halophilus TaxID=1736908 RepID=A0A6M1TPZ4_9BACT|nr:N-formylglutamate amidohydrolase [Fodinibius halophilus]NGP90280.1 N-formylglutamate amidohydrolase [Fodinibius halophilus]